MLPDVEPRMEAPRAPHARVPAGDVRRLQGRRWIVSQTGDIYHYDSFNPRSNIFDRLSIYHVDPRAWRLESLTYAKAVLPAAPPPDDGRGVVRVARRRRLDARVHPADHGRRGKAIAAGVRYEPFAQKDLTSRAAGLLQDAKCPTPRR